MDSQRLSLPRVRARPRISGTTAGFASAVVLIVALGRIELSSKALGGC